jgi:hypothetical protein
VPTDVVADWLREQGQVETVKASSVHTPMWVVRAENNVLCKTVEPGGATGCKASTNTLRCSMANDSSADVVNVSAASEENKNMSTKKAADMTSGADSFKHTFTDHMTCRGMCGVGAFEKSTLLQSTPRFASYRVPSSSNRAVETERGGGRVDERQTAVARKRHHTLRRGSTAPSERGAQTASAVAHLFLHVQCCLLGVV